MQMAHRLKLVRVTATSDQTLDFDHVNQHHHHARSGPSGATGQDAPVHVVMEHANDNDLVCMVESAMVRRSRSNNGKI